MSNQEMQLDQPQPMSLDDSGNQAVQNIASQAVPKKDEQGDVKMIGAEEGWKDKKPPKPARPAEPAQPLEEQFVPLDEQFGPILRFANGRKYRVRWVVQQQQAPHVQGYRPVFEVRPVWNGGQCTGQVYTFVDGECPFQQSAFQDLPVLHPSRVFYPVECPSPEKCHFSHLTGGICPHGRFPMQDPISWYKDERFADFSRIRMADMVKFWESNDFGKALFNNHKEVMRLIVQYDAWHWLPDHPQPKIICPALPPLPPAVGPDGKPLLGPGGKPPDENPRPVFPDLISVPGDGFFVPLLSEHEKAQNEDVRSALERSKPDFVCNNCQVCKARDLESEAEKARAKHSSKESKEAKRKPSLLATDKTWLANVPYQQKHYAQFLRLRERKQEQQGLDCEEASRRQDLDLALYGIDLVPCDLLFCYHPDQITKPTAVRNFDPHCMPRKGMFPEDYAQIPDLALACCEKPVEVVVMSNILVLVERRDTQVCAFRAVLHDEPFSNPKLVDQERLFTPLVIGPCNFPATRDVIAGAYGKNGDEYRMAPTCGWQRTVWQEIFGYPGTEIPCQRSEEEFFFQMQMPIGTRFPPHRDTVCGHVAENRLLDGTFHRGMVTCLQEELKASSLFEEKNPDVQSLYPPLLMWKDHYNHFLDRYLKSCDSVSIQKLIDEWNTYEKKKWEKKESQKKESQKKESWASAANVTKMFLALSQCSVAETKRFQVNGFLDFLLAVLSKEDVTYAEDLWTPLILKNIVQDDKVDLWRFLRQFMEKRRSTRAVANISAPTCQFLIRASSSAESTAVVTEICNTQVYYKRMKGRILYDLEDLEEILKDISQDIHAYHREDADKRRLHAERFMERLAQFGEFEDDAKLIEMLCFNNDPSISGAVQRRFVVHLCQRYLRGNCLTTAAVIAGRYVDNLKALAEHLPLYSEGSETQMKELQQKIAGVATLAKNKHLEHKALQKRTKKALETKKPKTQSSKAKNTAPSTSSSSSSNETRSSTPANTSSSSSSTTAAARIDLTADEQQKPETEKKRTTTLSLGQNRKRKTRKDSESEEESESESETTEESGSEDDMPKHRGSRGAKRARVTRYSKPTKDDVKDWEEERQVSQNAQRRKRAPAKLPTLKGMTKLFEAGKKNNQNSQSSSSETKSVHASADSDSESSESQDKQPAKSSAKRVLSFPSSPASSGANLNDIALSDDVLQAPAAVLQGQQNSGAVPMQEDNNTSSNNSNNSSSSSSQMPSANGNQAPTAKKPPTSRYINDDITIESSDDEQVDSEMMDSTVFKHSHSARAMTPIPRSRMPTPEEIADTQPVDYSMLDLEEELALQRTSLTSEEITLADSLLQNTVSENNPRMCLNCGKAPFLENNAVRGFWHCPNCQHYQYL